MGKKKGICNFDGMQLKIIIMNNISSCIKSYEINSEDEGIDIFNKNHNTDGCHYTFVYVDK